MRCPHCDADVLRAVSAGGEVVLLEHFTEPAGPNRWRAVEAGPPMVVVPMAPAAPGDGYADHRADCRGFE